MEKAFFFVNPEPSFFSLKEDIHFELGFELIFLSVMICYVLDGHSFILDIFVFEQFKSEYFSHSRADSVWKWNRLNVEVSLLKFKSIFVLMLEELDSLIEFWIDKLCQPWPHFFGKFHKLHYEQTFKAHYIVKNKCRHVLPFYYGWSLPSLDLYFELDFRIFHQDLSELFLN